MTRDEEFAGLAREYAAAAAELESADRTAREWVSKVESHRRAVDGLRAKLGGFVGRNLPGRYAIMPGGKVFYVEYTPPVNGLEMGARVGVAEAVFVREPHGGD